VTLGATLAEPLAALAPARHLRRASEVVVVVVALV
jgi:hypothetical protein